MENLILS